MGQVTGTIGSVEEKSGFSQKNGKPWTMYSLVLTDGTKHSMGFDKPAYAPGQTVTFTMEQNGQYMNMKKGSMQLSDGNPAATPDTGGAGPVAHVASGPTANQLQIMRQNAVTNANAFAAHQNWEGDQAGIIDIAREFLAFYTGELDQKKAEGTFTGDGDIPF